jgi:hypothetical protein
MVQSSDIIAEYILIKGKYKQARELHEKCLEFFYKRYGQFIKDHQNEIKEYYKNEKQNNVQYGSDTNSNNKSNNNKLNNNKSNNNKSNNNKSNNNKSNNNKSNNKSFVNNSELFKENNKSFVNNSELFKENNKLVDTKVIVEEQIVIVIPNDNKGVRCENIIKSYKKTIKYLYKKISIRTHPDRCKNVYEQKYFMKAKNAFESNNITKLFIIAFKLKIKLKYIDDKFLSYIFTDILKVINVYKSKIDKIVFSDEWKWFHKEYRIEAVVNFK